MKIGERGQVTIPRDIREQFGLRPDTEVEFRVVKGVLTIEKAPRKLDLQRWKGRCQSSFAELGYAAKRGKQSPVEQFIDDVRGH